GAQSGPGGEGGGPPVARLPASGERPLPTTPRAAARPGRPGWRATRAGRGRPAGAPLPLQPGAPPLRAQANPGGEPPWAPPPQLSAGCQRLRALSRSATGGTSAPAALKGATGPYGCGPQHLRAVEQLALQGPDTWQVARPPGAPTNPPGDHPCRNSYASSRSAPSSRP